jgi:hypothetical protein
MAASPGLVNEGIHLKPGLTLCHARVPKVLLRA